MLNLLQKSFLEAVLDPKDAPEFIASAHAKERFNVYRQTIFFNLQQTLSSTFPGIWALLGDATANSIAYEFYVTHRHLPTSACLDDYGEKFPNFLKNLEQLRSYPYLSDYADYEWLKHLVKQEKHVNALLPEDFLSINNIDWEQASFEFIDAFKMFQSHHPIDEIQHMLTNPDIPSITLNTQSSYSIVVRPQEELLTYWINQDRWIFIHRLWKGGTLFDSAEALLEQYPNFNLVESLRFIFQHHMIKKIRRAPHVFQ